jgi:hypothetical protein
MVDDDVLVREDPGDRRPRRPKTQATDADTGATAAADASSSLSANPFGGLIRLQDLPFQCPTSSALVSHGLPHPVPVSQASPELSAATLAISESTL